MRPKNRNGKMLHERSQKGYALMMAVGLSAVIGLWVMGGMSMVMASYRSAARNASMVEVRASTECALDYVVSDLSTNSGGGANSTWGSLDQQGTTATTTVIPPYLYGYGQAGGNLVVKVKVQKVTLPVSSGLYNPSSPTTSYRLVTAQATAPNGARKTIRVAVEPILIPPANNPWFLSTMFAKTTLSMSSNLSTDSYDSTKGAYGGSNITYHGDIGSNGAMTFPGDSATVGGDVIGYGASVSGSSSYTVKGNVYSNGSISTFKSNTASGKVMGVNNTGATANKGQLVTNAGNTAPTIPAAPTHPSGATPLGDFVVPAGGTSLPAGDYYATSITTAGPLSLGGQVRIFVEGTTAKTNAISINGQVGPAAGMVPKNFQVYTNSTKPTQITMTQTFSGCIYAPSSKVTVNPNGTNPMFGSVVGNSMDIGGNQGVTFHYDTSLGSDSTMQISSGSGDSGCRAVSWQELPPSAPAL